MSPEFVYKLATVLISAATVVSSLYIASRKILSPKKLELMSRQFETVYLPIYKLIWNYADVLPAKQEAIAQLKSICEIMQNHIEFFSLPLQQRIALLSEMLLDPADSWKKYYRILHTQLSDMYFYSRKKSIYPVKLSEWLSARQTKSSKALFLAKIFLGVIAVASILLGLLFDPQKVIADLYDLSTRVLLATIATSLLAFLIFYVASVIYSSAERREWKPSSQQKHKVRKKK